MKCCVACRYDYFCNGTYEVSPKSAEDVSKDQVNVTRGYLKLRNKVRKILTLLTSAPPVKASPGHNPYFIYTATYIIYIYLCIRFLGIV
jgi:hypothetical protein